MPRVCGGATLLATARSEMLRSVMCRAPVAAEESRAAASPPGRFQVELLDVGADDRIPALGNRLLAGRLLVERREDCRVVGHRRRHLVEEFLRNGALLGEVAETDRMA